MKEFKPNSFNPARAVEGPGAVPLAVAQNLARIYADVLEEPVPEPLQRLIERWQRRHDADGGVRA